MKKVLEVLGAKKDIKEFEDFLRENGKATDLFIENLSPYNADLIGYLRWATLDPTGRLARYFKKQTQITSTLKNDWDGELISIIWYKLFLKNREHYLTERVWKYMINKRNRQCIIINFDGTKRTAPAKTSAKYKVFTFPRKFLHTLDKNGEIRKQLTLKVQNIKNMIQQETQKPGEIEQNKLMTKKLLTGMIMLKVRELQVNKAVFDWQQHGIKCALNRWIEEEALGKELSKCFKLFYRNEAHYTANKHIPIFNYELASQFLFMFQNLAIFCPEVKVVYLFAYTYASKNSRNRSSLSFLFKKAGNHQALISCSDKIFDFLADIESVPDTPKQIEYNSKDYPLWSSAFGRLSE